MPPPRERVSRAVAEGRQAECVCEAESELESVVLSKRHRLAEAALAQGQLEACDDQVPCINGCSCVCVCVCIRGVYKWLLVCVCLCVCAYIYKGQLEAGDDQVQE